MVVDATRHVGLLGDFVAHHEAAFDVIVAVHASRKERNRAAPADLIHAGHRLVVFDVDNPVPDTAAVVTNTFRHFSPDIVFVMETRDRLVVDEGTLAAALREAPVGSRLVIRGPNRGRPPNRFQVVGRPHHRTAPRVVLDGVTVEQVGTHRSLRIPGRFRTSRRRVMRRVSAEVARLQPLDQGTTRGTAGVLDAGFHTEKPYLDLAPFGHIWDRFRPTSVLDIGCGLGGYLRFFSLSGAKDVVGIDGFPPSSNYLAGPGYLQHDLRGPLRLGRRFDLVVCTEVVEHIDDRSSGTVLDTIERHAVDTILFSAAQPGQPGEGHVNCLPLSRWLDRWSSRGWVADAFDSLAVRSLANFHWFRRNLVVLRRGPLSRSTAFGATDLDGVEARRMPWADQAPGVCTRPLERGLPPMVPAASRWGPPG